MTRAKAETMRAVAMHVALLFPPPGVAFCLRAKDEDIVERAVAAEGAIQFDFSMQVRRTGESGLPRFVGRFAFGPPAGRFIYIGSGTFAGQEDSCWSRRAKIGLTGITWEMIDQSGGRLISPEIRADRQHRPPAILHRGAARSRKADRRRRPGR